MKKGIWTKSISVVAFAIGLAVSSVQGANLTVDGDLTVVSNTTLQGSTVIRDPGNNGALILSPSIFGSGVDPEFVIQSAEGGGAKTSPFHISRNALFRTSDGTYQYIDDEGQPASKIEFQSDGDIAFSAAASGTGAVSFTESMTIKQGGKVGIGTANPQSALDLEGDMRVSGVLLINPAGDLAMGEFTSGPQP